MSTNWSTSELKWDRHVTLALAITLSLPILAVTGLLTALAANPGAGPASPAVNAPYTLTYTVGSDPLGIAYDSAHANMWVVNHNDDTVSVLRASDGFHVMTPTVGTSPRGIAFDGANMWVTNNASHSVSVLRASDGALVKTVAVGSNPYDIAFDGAFMWVANVNSDSVSKR